MPSATVIRRLDSVGEMPPPPAQCELHQNFPNPFNPEPSIEFDIPVAVNVSLVIRDLTGQVVRKLVDSGLEAGVYINTWDGRDQDGRYVSNGLYPYEMIAGDFLDQKVLCLNMLAPEQIIQLKCIPIVNSDAEGKFVLGYSSVPSGETVAHTDAQGEDLGELLISQVSIMLIKEGFQSLLESLPSDTSRSFDIHCRMEAMAGSWQ